MLDRAAAYRYAPSTREDVKRVLATARARSTAVVIRGSGYSYGDASLLREGIDLDMTGMNRVLSWDPGHGIIRVEPGVTIRDLWAVVLPDGWWPPVVPGAMYPTVAGCLAVNAHGKNNWRMGTLGEHVLDLELLTPAGDLLELSPNREPELFYAAISSVGMLGVILSVRLRMGRVQSGLLDVSQIALPDLAGMLAALRANAGASHYMVGWIDAFASGASSGRGLVQLATHSPDPNPRTLSTARQDPPERLFGLVPRSELWRPMKLTVNDRGMRAINETRYLSGRAMAGRSRQVPHAQFQFFHDYVPGWKRSWKPGGILQYQVFVPESRAESVFAALLAGSRNEGMVPYLAVLKLHRADDRFLLRYNCDGYSLSLDYHATRRTVGRYREILRRWTDEIVLPAGGRFYLAKDSVLTREQAARMYGHDTIARFTRLKHEVDPKGLLQSELYRRLFA